MFACLYAIVPYTCPEKSDEDISPLNWSYKQVWASIQVLVPELGPLQERKIL